jgi:hypothetical protein
MKIFGKLLIIASFSIAIQAQAATTDVICSYAPSQNAAVNRISAGLGGAGAGVAAMLEAAGMTAVAHSSGAYIITGSGGYIAGTLGSAVLAPILITTSVVVAGAAVTVELSCVPKNHPKAINIIEKYRNEFEKALIKANNKAINIRDAASDKAIEFKDSAARLIARGTVALQE